MTISGYGKFDINAQNFWNSSPNSIKIKFLNSSHRTLANDIYLVQFRAEVRIYQLFSIVFGNYIIMKSFVVTWFLNLYIL